LQAKLNTSATEAKAEANVASLAKTQQELEGHMVNSLINSTSQTQAPSTVPGAGQNINIKV